MTHVRAAGRKAGERLASFVRRHTAVSARAAARRSGQVPGAGGSRLSTLCLLPVGLSVCLSVCVPAAPLRLIVVLSLHDWRRGVVVSGVRQ